MDEARYHYFVVCPLKVRRISEQSDRHRSSDSDRQTLRIIDKENREVKDHSEHQSVHEDIIADLENILHEIQMHGQECGCEVTASVGVSRGPYTPITPTGPYQWSKRLFKGQAQKLAHKALRKAKKNGGNCIIFL